MRQIIHDLANAQNGNAINNLAETYKISPAEAEAAIEQIVPELSFAMERNTLSRGGLADLVKVLGQVKHEDYLDDASLLGTPQMVADGNAVLGNAFGSKDKSRFFAERASRASGLSAGLIKQLLPVIAAMVMGGLAKNARGPLTDIMSRIPGFGGKADAAPPPPTMDRGPLSMPGSTGGHSSGGSAGGFEGHQPLPVPGNNIPGAGRRGPNPYGDLTEIIRRGGRGGAAPGGAGTLWSLIRSILGGALGFESRGFLGWVIKLLLSRWGMGILKFLFGRIFAR